MRGATMLLLLRRMLVNAVQSAHSRRIGNRREPRGGAGNNNRLARGRNLYKRELVLNLETGCKIVHLAQGKTRKPIACTPKGTFTAMYDKVTPFDSVTLEQTT